MMIPHISTTRNGFPIASQVERLRRYLLRQHPKLRRRGAPHLPDDAQGGSRFCLNIARPFNGFLTRVTSHRLPGIRE